MTTQLNLFARVIQVIGNHLGKPEKELRYLDIPKKTIRKKVPTSMGDVWVIIYAPEHVNKDIKPPVYVNFHGGGFIIRNPDSDDHICRYIADKAGCFVVNVDYDVAPQKPFPVAPIQSYEVVQWVIENGTDYGWDSSNLAVGGQSAGGNLAAGVCLNCLEHGTQLPKLQVLLYPALDLAMPPEEKTSVIEKPMINAKISTVFNDAYLPNIEDRKNPLASPLLASDFSKLPRALVITAEFDLLCNEAHAYAEALSESGVEVNYCMVKNVDHAFTHTGPVDEAKEAISLIADTVRDTFNR